MRSAPSGPTDSILGSVPPMIRAIMAISIVAWLAALVTRYQPAGFWELFILSWDGLVSAGRVWSFVTYQFLHSASNFAHILFNLFALWMFGRDLEGRWGGWAFLRFYLVCGVGGGVLWVLADRFLLSDGRMSVIGASGAVLGIVTAWALIWPDRQILFMFVIPLRAKSFLLITACLEVLLAWAPNAGIANFAHLGGMATGWAILRHGWRLRRPFSFLEPAWSRVRTLWRRRHVRVVDRDWEDWLHRNDPDKRNDDTRH